jgi:IS30 family transposase
MMYRQITSAERYALGVLRRQGLCAAAIARALGRHRSTIGREVRRNRAHADGSYRPQLADWYAGGRRSRSRRNQRFTTPDRALVAAFLWEQWSPEQVVGYLRRHGILRISHETIYRFVWTDWRQGGQLYTQLRGARRAAPAPQTLWHTRVPRARGREAAHRHATGGRRAADPGRALGG